MQWLLILAILTPVFAGAKAVVRTSPSDSQIPAGAAQNTRPSEPGADFLAAKSIVELELEQDELAGRFFRLMANVLDEDPDLAARLVLQADRLVRQEEKNGGWVPGPSRNGWPQIGEWFLALIRKQDPVDAAALIVRVVREDTEGRVPVSGWDDFYELGRPLWRRFAAHGGNYDTPLALDRLSKSFRARCGAGSTLAVHSAWNRFAQHLRPAQFRAAVAWAELNASGNGSGDPEIARQLLFALRFFEQSFPCDWEPEDSGPVFARTVEILENDELSLAWRLGFAQFLSERARAKLPPEVSLACGVVCAQALETETPAPSISHAHAMAAFLRAHGHVDWQPLAGRLWSAWKHRNRNNAKPNETGLAFDPEREAVLTMMEINYLAENRAAARRTLQDFENTASAWEGAFVLMVENGDHRFATYLFKENIGSSFYGFDNYPLDIRASSKLEIALPAYLDTIDDPEWRLAAEIWLSATHDLELPGWSLSDSRPSAWMSERLSNLASKFAEDPPVGKTPRRRSLECLSMSEAPLDPIHEILEDQRQRLPQDLRAARSGVEVYWLTTVASRRAVAGYVDADPEPLRKLWHEILQDIEPYDGKQRDCAEAILDQQSDISLYFGMRQDFDTLRPMLSLMRELVATAPDDQYLRDFTRTTTRVFAAHALCGEAEVLRKWWETLPERRQQLLTGGLALYRKAIPDFVRFTNSAKSQPGEIPTELRQRLFSGVLSQKYIAGGYPGLPVLALAASFGGLTEEDLAVLAPAIVEKAPRAGAAHAEWTGLMAEAGQAARAVGALNGGIERAAADLDLLAQLQLEKAGLLEHLDRRREALHLIDSLPEEVGAGEVRENYAEALRILRLRLWDWSLSGAFKERN